MWPRVVTDASGGKVLRQEQGDSARQRLLHHPFTGAVACLSLCCGEEQNADSLRSSPKPLAWCHSEFSNHASLTIITYLFFEVLVLETIAYR